MSTRSSPTRIVHPSIPFATDIPALTGGCAILIRGVVKDESYKRFSVDLCCGRLVTGDHRDDIALHINPRFDKTFGGFFSKPADNQIVLNSLQNNVWGMEHRASNSLAEGKPFSLRILVLQQYYKLTLNGMLLADFVHRIPVDQIKCLYISGSVGIEQIEFHGTGDQPTLPSPVDETGDFEPKNFQKPTVPFVQSLKGFLPPRKIQITGTPRMNATRFTVNFMIRGEFLFHFRVDLPSRDNPQGYVVRNSTKEEEWLEEERDLPYYPFKVGHTADLVFVAHNTNCEVNVDGRTLCVFNYRDNLRAKDVDSFTIQGDLIVQTVNFS